MLPMYCIYMQRGAASLCIHAEHPVHAKNFVNGLIMSIKLPVYVSGKKWMKKNESTSTLQKICTLLCFCCLCVFHDFQVLVMDGVVVVPRCGCTVVPRFGCGFFRGVGSWISNTLVSFSQVFTVRRGMRETASHTATICNTTWWAKRRSSRSLSNVYIFVFGGNGGGAHITLLSSSRLISNMMQLNFSVASTTVVLEGSESDPWMDASR